MIDSLTEHIGEPLHNLWEREGGTEQYPPPSIHVSILIKETVCTNTNVIFQSDAIIIDMMDWLICLHSHIAVIVSG